jgi:CheY-like chemotaxis protein
MVVNVAVTVEKDKMAVILVVEDDAFIREIAEMTIQEWGHQVLSASDVDEALCQLHSSQQIDALFTDIYLKSAMLGGCELAREAIKIRPLLRVLYTTGNFVTERMKSMFVGGTDCLRKPYTEHQLRNSVEHLLGLPN